MFNELSNDFIYVILFLNVDKVIEVNFKNF